MVNAGSGSLGLRGGRKAAQNSSNSYRSPPSHDPPESKWRRRSSLSSYLKFGHDRHLTGRVPSMRRLCSKKEPQRQATRTFGSFRIASIAANFSSPAVSALRYLGIGLKVADVKPMAQCALNSYSRSSRQRCRKEAPCFIESFRSRCAC
jgi:hypothetical protein